MTQDYVKMEESNLEQHGIITSLEQTYEDLREQQVVAHIKIDREKKKSYFSNLRIQGLVWNNQGTIEKT